MNFYGTKITPAHTLAGRLIPLSEASHRAITKACNQPLAEPKYSAQLPRWCHNICDQFAKTIFRTAIKAAPQAEKLDARNYGRMVGMLLRGAVFIFKDVPALLQRDGLFDLSKGQEQKLKKMSGSELLFPVASERFQQPIANEHELFKAAESQFDAKTDQLMAQIPTVLQHLVDRPVAEQYEFLCGIPEGFIMLVDNQGDFTGKRNRFEIYVSLLVHWPEIAEMQRANPPKNRRDLLGWLEKQEGRQLFEDPKGFYELCGDIDLDLAPPGHPHKVSPS